MPPDQVRGRLPNKVLGELKAGMIGDDLDWLNGLIDRARRNAEHLGDHQIQFVDSMLVNAERWGERMFFSAKQRRFAKATEATLDAAGVSHDPEDWY